MKQEEEYTGNIKNDTAGWNNKQGGTGV